MDKRDQALLQAKPISIYSLYDGYAGMLLGYIFEIVKDHKLAEDYLARTFGTIAKQFNEINWAHVNKWRRLQQFAQNELADFFDTIKSNDPAAITNAIHYDLPNRYLAKMTDEQRHIFCSLYYSRKTTAELVHELNKSEALMRKSLKDIFSLIRNMLDD